MVVCGLGAVPRLLEIFARLDKRAPAQTRFEVISHPEIFDGVRVHEGQVLAVIRHNARVLLSCERVILNLMQHLSGIATLTRQFVDAIHGTHAHVLDTRKTVPGLRALEKYAVLCGGGTNHRLDLASGILIKNNHISLGGGLPTVLTQALERRQKGQRVQVEVRIGAGTGRGSRIRRRSDSARQHDARRGEERSIAAHQAGRSAGFPPRPPAASFSKTSAPTPKPAWTSSASAR